MSLDENPKRPTIFMLVTQGFEARYFLQSDICDHLIKNGFSVVVMSTSSEEHEFVSTNTKPHLSHEKLRIKQYEEKFGGSKVWLALTRLRQYVLGGGDSLYTPLNDKTQSGQARGKPNGAIKRSLFDLGLIILRVSPLARRILISIENYFFKAHCHQDIFELYHPVALITSGIGFRLAETLLSREAIAYGAKVISIIYSWDKACSQGYKGIEPDGVVAWGPAMKKEIVVSQEIAPRKILLAGNAFLDKLLKKGNLFSRSNYLNSIKLDSNKKTILFATKSPNTYPNYLVAEMLAQIIDNKYKDKCQLLVRLHPIHLNKELQHTEFGCFLRARYESIEAKYSFVKVYIPKGFTENIPMYMQRSEEEVLIDQIRSSDIIITPFSTLMLEAFCYDKPVININFDINEKNQPKEFRPITIDAQQTHIRRIISYACSWVATRLEDLEVFISEAMLVSEEKLKNMQTALSEECGQLDGSVGQRIADFIGSIINEKKRKN